MNQLRKVFEFDKEKLVVKEEGVIEIMEKGLARQFSYLAQANQFLEKAVNEKSVGEKVEVYANEIYAEFPAKTASNGVVVEEGYVVVVAFGKSEHKLIISLASNNMYESTFSSFFEGQRKKLVSEEVELLTYLFHVFIQEVEAIESVSKT